MARVLSMKIAAPVADNIDDNEVEPENYARSDTNKQATETHSVQSILNADLLRSTFFALILQQSLKTCDKKIGVATA